jgi:hypothetical protein
MLWNTITTYLQSWFDYAGVAGTLILLCAVLALVFGAVWLLGHRPPFLKKPSLWLTAIASALITLVATAFIYISINYYYVQWLGDTFDNSTLADTALLWSIPIVLLVGLVQEGAKMVPMLFWRSGSVKPDIGTWIAIGAVAGAGFGIFEAFNGMCNVFGSGWDWGLVSATGITALLPFWICFWMIACHIGISAVVGYGLAKHRGGGFYGLAVFLHALIAYAAVLATNGTITGNQLGIIVAVAGLIIILISYWLRWRKYGDETPVAVPAATPQAYPQAQTPPPIPPAPPKQDLPPPPPTTR